MIGAGVIVFLLVLAACDIENVLDGKAADPAADPTLGTAPGTTTSPTSPTDPGPATTTAPGPATTADTGGTPPESTPPGTADTAVAPPIDTGPVELASCGAPIEAPCAPGDAVTLGYTIPAEAMLGGASDPNGAGSCCGVVVFAADLTNVQQIGMFDYATSSVAFADFNGVGDGSCGLPHCQDLWYGDGRVHPQYCTIVAMCVDGVAVATGYTW